MHNMDNDERPPLLRIITKAAIGEIDDISQSSSKHDVFFVRFYNQTENQTFIMTRIWFECDHPIDIFQEKLPITIYPIHGMEPWIDVDMIPEKYHTELEKFLRVQISTGEILSGAMRKGER